MAAGIVPGAKAAAAKQQAKGQTLKERLAACRASERERLAFGKVLHSRIRQHSNVLTDHAPNHWRTSELSALAGTLLCCLT